MYKIFQLVVPLKMECIMIINTFIAVVTSNCAGGKEPTAGSLFPMKPSRTQMIIDIIHCDSVTNNGAFS